MISIIIVAAVIATPQLEAKADLAYRVGFCYDVAWLTPQAKRIETALAKLPSSDYERGYLSVAFEVGKEDKDIFNKKIGSKNLNKAITVIVEECTNLESDLNNAKP